jgi:hypothetical protein
MSARLGRMAERGARKRNVNYPTLAQTKPARMGHPLFHDRSANFGELADSDWVSSKRPVWTLQVVAPYFSGRRIVKNEKLIRTGIGVIDSEAPRLYG